MRSSTCLRGIMCVDRAKAMTCSRRKPGNGGGNVLMRRGSLGTPSQRVRAERVRTSLSPALPYTRKNSSHTVV